MKNNCLNYIILFTVVLLVTSIFSCSGRPGKNTIQKEAVTEMVDSEEFAAELIKFISPVENAEFRLNEKIKVLIEPEGKRLPDSVKIWFGGNEAGVLKGDVWEYEIPSVFNDRTGKK
ncbi:MAG: hypothetical protein ACUVTX_02265, partial [Bacteroidales bacterium]